MLLFQFPLGVPAQMVSAAFWTVGDLEQELAGQDRLL